MPGGSRDCIPAHQIHCSSVRATLLDGHHTVVHLYKSIGWVLCVRVWAHAQIRFRWKPTQRAAVARVEARPPSPHFGPLHLPNLAQGACQDSSGTAGWADG
jgi:hypothetical protein